MHDLKILALVLGALILVPSGAHLLEITHKISMERDAYFAVQRIYTGWERRQWEYGHVAIAIVTVAAFVAIALSTVGRSTPRS